MLNSLKNLPWKTTLRILGIVALLAIFLFTPLGQVVLGAIGVSTAGVFVAKFLFSLLVPYIPSWFSFFPQIISSLIIAAGSAFSIYFINEIVKRIADVFNDIFNKRPLFEEEDGDRFKKRLRLLVKQAEVKDTERLNILQELFSLLPMSEFSQALCIINTQKDLVILKGLAIKFGFDLLNRVKGNNEKTINITEAEHFLPILAKLCNVEYQKNNLHDIYDMIKKKLKYYIPEELNANDFKLKKGDEGILGKGGHGVVFKTIWNERDIAVKVSRDELSVELFCEYSALEELKKFVLVPKVYGIVKFCDGRIPYGLAMENIGEFNLKKVIENDEKDRIRQIVYSRREYVVKRIFFIVETFHNQYNLIYGDFKLDNFVVSIDPKNGEIQIKICDFGSAGPAKNPRQYRGTPSYVPPEHEKEVEEESNPFKWSLVTKKVDIYVVTLVIWEIIEFYCLSALEIPRSALRELINRSQLYVSADNSRGELKSLEFTKSSLPPKLSHLITLGMHKSRGRRPTAEEMLTELSEEKTQTTISQYHPTFTCRPSL